MEDILQNININTLTPRERKSLLFWERLKHNNKLRAQFTKDVEDYYVLGNTLESCRKPIGLSTQESDT